MDKFLNAQGKMIKGQAINVPPGLSLHSASYEFSFPTGFTEQELWWMGQELSDFLNVELQIIRPTPTIPDEPASCGGGC